MENDVSKYQPKGKLEHMCSCQRKQSLKEKSFLDMGDYVMRKVQFTLDLLRYKVSKF